MIYAALCSADASLSLSLSLAVSLLIHPCAGLWTFTDSETTCESQTASHKLRVRNCWRRVRNYSFTRQSSFHCFVYVYVKYRICALHVQNCTVYAQSASTWNLDHQSTWLALVQGCSEGEGEAARFSTAEVVEKEEAGTGWYRPLMANVKMFALCCLRFNSDRPSLAQPEQVLSCLATDAPAAQGCGEGTSLSSGEQSTARGAVDGLSVEIVERKGK